MAEGDDGPEPCAGVEDEEQTIDADDFAAEISGGVVEEGEQAGTRRVGCADGVWGDEAGRALHGRCQPNSTIFGFVRM